MKGGGEEWRRNQIFFVKKLSFVGKLEVKQNLFLGYLPSVCKKERVG